MTNLNRQPAAQPTERERRLMDAIEGECDGLAISMETAREVLRYVDTGLPPDETKPVCVVRGLLAPSAMCGSYRVGGGCGHVGDCEHKG